MEDNDECIEFEEPDITGVCTSCKKEVWVTDTFIDNEKQSEILCYDCCGKEGYCFGCGEFQDGDYQYHSSRVGFYCGNCQDQISDTCSDNGEELEPWEYPDFQGFSEDNE